MLENNSSRLIGAAIAVVVGGSLLGIVHVTAPQQVNHVVANIQKVIGVDQQEQIAPGNYVAEDGNLYSVTADSDDATLIAVGANGTKKISSSATIKGKTYKVTTIDSSSIDSGSLGKIQNASTFTRYTPTNDIVDLNIPEGITTIADARALYDGGGGAYLVSSISLPETLQTIGEEAFGNVTRGDGSMPAISKLTIPKNITSIGKNAFYASESNGRLQEIDFEAGSKLKDIQEAAFAGQSMLTTINFAEGVETIGNFAFIDHNVAMNVDIPASVKSVGIGAFAYRNTPTGTRPSYNFKGTMPTLGDKALDGYNPTNGIEEY